MSHPRVVQACRFYNTSYQQAQQQQQEQQQGQSSATCTKSAAVIPPYATGPSTPHLRSRETHETAIHPPYKGEVGFHHSLQRKVDASLLDPPEKHHLTWGLGIKQANQERSNVFTRLPGRTFNADTWNQYQHSATLSLRARSPMRKRGVV